jgi:hypothetical protein
MNSFLFKVPLKNKYYIYLSYDIDISNFRDTVKKN